ncbi:uncharacterized protein LOC134823519 [Bolinopsis microptera]|uniref:uncharacterized protein LOC134823519 n=1 Tax=Bolinopsis microptera TaxID=2820187 RepID=UPI00307948F5
MPHNYIVTQLRLLDSSHQDVGISKLNTNLANLSNLMKELRNNNLDLSEMEQLYKDFQGVQYRLEGQKEGIGRAKSQALQEASPKTAIQNLGKHYKMLYRNALENEPQHQGVALPAPRQAASAEDESAHERQLQDELESEGVVVASAKVSLACPISQTRMVHPMVNAQCGHTYDRTAVNEHIRRCRSLTVKCPVAGCVGFVNQANLRPNKKIAELLAQDSGS